MSKEKQSAQELFDSLNNDPQAVIMWAELEIKAYQELIKLLKNMPEPLSSKYPCVFVRKL